MLRSHTVIPTLLFCLATLAGCGQMPPAATPIHASSQQPSVSAKYVVNFTGELKQVATELRHAYEINVPDYSRQLTVMNLQKLSSWSSDVYRFYGYESDTGLAGVSTLYAISGTFNRSSGEISIVSREKTDAIPM